VTPADVTVTAKRMSDTLRRTPLQLHFCGSIPMTQGAGVRVSTMTRLWTEGWMPSLDALEATRQPVNSC
jgi:hypothetical protein